MDFFPLSKRVLPFPYYFYFMGAFMVHPKIKVYRYSYFKNL